MSFISEPTAVSLSDIAESVNAKFEKRDEAIRQEERERCAKLCEAIADSGICLEPTDGQEMLMYAAEMIRKGGDPDGRS